MKITLISPMPPIKGGISPYNILLYQELSKKHEVNIISFKRLYPKFLYPGENEKDTISKEKIIDAKSERILDGVNPLTWFKTFLKIKKQKSDLVIIHWWNPFFSFMTFFIFFMLRFTKTKKLIICHNVMPHEKLFMAKFLTKIAYKQANFFIVHSNNELNQLKKLVKNPNVRVYPLPTYEFYKRKVNSEEFRKKLGLRRRVILFFGFIRPSKGLIYLIRAMPKILKKIDLDLLIVGEFLIEKEKLKMEYLNEIKKLNIEQNIKFIDRYVPNEDVAKYFGVADVTILPYESATGSAILQIALGLRKPVICTEVLKEVVKDKITGIVVPIKNPDALAEAVLEFYKKGSKFFIRNIERDKKRFSWGGLVKTIEDF